MRETVVGFALALLAQTTSPAQAPVPTAGLGRISFPNAGPTAAQPAFLRGVLLLHSFEYDEAIQAFREAQRLAPGFALAYWGEALCHSQPLWYNENVANAREALARLAPTREARAAKAPSVREKGYLDAVERLFGDGDRPARLRAYSDRMAQLARENPADHEATVLYALALLGTIPEAERRLDVSLKAGALAADILKKNPQHPGAAHYMLHAYDDGENNRMALEAARIYAKIAPASSHALHMPSHAFLPLGMWDEAVASDEVSFRVSVEWVKRTGRTLAQQDFHSLSWLHYEYLQQGRFAEARRLLEPLKTALGQAPKPTGRSGPQAPHHSEINRGWDAQGLENEMASMRARAIIESGSWAEMRGQGSFGNVDELFALGMSSAKLGDLARADAAVGQMQMAAKAITDRDVREVIAIMLEQLSGLIQLSRGDRAAGLASLARAADLEAKRRRPIARPYPIKPAAELYGEALLASGDSARATEQFRRALDRTPRRASALLGLARAQQKTGMSAEAGRAARELLDVWTRADAGRPELAEIRRIADAR